jgi:hypothetical protein
MTYDSLREVVVLFGGSGLYDTWEYNGTDWVQRNPANHPSAGGNSAMSYDSARGVTVLFGGGTYLDDTWEYDGTHWTQRNPVTHPSPRGRMNMVFDTARGMAVIFGGYWEDYPDNEVFGDTWEYIPLVPRPVLMPIGNTDGDGEYLVEWSTVTIAISYTLEEDNNFEFTSPTVRYQGDQTEFQVSGKGSGYWYYRVKASNGQVGDSHWSNIESTVVHPEAPELFPIANGDGDGIYLVDWSDAFSANAYELQEDDNSAFSSPTVRYAGSNSQYQISGQQGGTWYYRVLASNAGGNSPWSNTESAGVIPVTPALLSINNTDLDGNYLVDWNDVTGALSYQLEEDDNIAFSSPTLRYEGDSSLYTASGQLPGLWYYRVRASNVTGTSTWSNVQTVNVIPDAPILVSISNIDGNGDYLVDWNDVIGATSYWLEEDNNSEFTSPTIRYNGTNSQYQVSAQPTGLWYYRVKANCAGGDSLWSNSESVSVAPAAPVLFSINNPDQNGDYLVDWSDVTGASSYRLEQDDNPSFTSPTVRYTGPSSYFQVYGQEIGILYYRVIAINTYGESTWSSTQAVIVGWLNYLALVTCNR